MENKIYPKVRNMWCIHAGAYWIFGCFWLEFILCSKLFWKRNEKKEKGEAPWKPAQPSAAQLPPTPPPPHCGPPSAGRSPALPRSSAARLPLSLTTGPRASAPSFFSPSAFRTGNQLRKESDLGFLGSFPLRLCSHIKAPNLARTPFFPFKPPVRALAAV